VWNGTSYVLLSSGITALNGLIAAAQLLTTGTSGTDFNISSVGTTHTFNIPTASATNRGLLSSGDWSTFNNKQNAITLTTTGTSGAATLVGSTLNIPQYQAALTNPVTGSGTTSYIPKFTGSTVIGNSILYDEGNNIGLGTTTPLAVSGYRGITINSTSGSFLSLYNLGTSIGRLENNGAANMQLITTGNYPLILSTNNTGRIWLTGDGKTGVNTNTPAYFFDIVGEFRSTGNTFLSTSGTNETLIGTTTSTAGGYKLQVAGSIYNTTEAVFAATSGNVQIGSVTTSSNYILRGGRSVTTVGDNVINTVAHFSNTNDNNTNGTTSYPVLSLERVGASGISNNSLFEIGLSRYSTANTNAFTQADFIVRDGNSNSRSTVATFSNSQITLRTADTDQMRLTSAGNLGIGTTSPQARLEVYPGTITGSATQEILRLDVPGNNIFSTGTGYINFRGYDVSNLVQRDIAWIGSQLISDSSFSTWFGGNLLFYTTNNGASQVPTERMRITGAGDVGIGTTSPSGTANRILNIYGAANNELHLTNATTGTGNTDGFTLLQSGNDVYAYNYEAGFFEFGTSNLARMRITSGGNVLIGTTTDNGALLQVAGTTRTTGSISLTGGTLPSALDGLHLYYNAGSLTAFIEAHFSGSGYRNLSINSGNLLLLTGGVQRAVISSAGNFGLGTSSFGTGATITISVFNGTAPGSSPADSFQLYSNDIVAGNAAPHIRTENGAVLKMYQETTGVGNAAFVQGSVNAVYEDSTFDGYTLKQIVKALRNQGLLA
jgi:hypothetical protein